MTSRIALPLLALAVALAGCGGSSKPTPPVVTKPTETTPDKAGVVWLCRPGIAPDPCRTNLATTVVEPDGTRHVEQDAPAANPPIDCFYVYPTVTPQKSANANLRIQDEERQIALAQAARFSQVCRVYAPMYRQVPLTRILSRKVTSENAIRSYLSVLKAFQDYLLHYNHGRGFVLIGHSQGATALSVMIRQHLDQQPKVRKRLVSAILLGANVLMANDADGRGDFAHVPPCASTTQVGCVVAYSSFASEPPKNSYFGRVGKGLNPFVSKAPPGLLHILCVNPGSPGGGTATLDSLLPSTAFSLAGGRTPGADVSTPWLAYPGAVTARCESKDGARWLQIDPQTAFARMSIQLAQSSLGDRWGLHLLDVNLALGNLVDLVRSEGAAYGR